MNKNNFLNDFELYRKTEIDKKQADMIKNLKEMGMLPKPEYNLPIGPVIKNNLD